MELKLYILWEKIACQLPLSRVRVLEFWSDGRAKASCEHGDGRCWVRYCAGLAYPRISISRAAGVQQCFDSGQAARTLSLSVIHLVMTRRSC